MYLVFPTQIGFYDCCPRFALTRLLREVSMMIFLFATVSIRQGALHLWDLVHENVGRAFLIQLGQPTCQNKFAKQFLQYNTIYYIALHCSALHRSCTVRRLHLSHLRHISNTYSLLFTSNTPGKILQTYEKED